MKIQFVYPPPGADPSGGHVFNRALLAEADRRGYPLQGLPAAPAEPLAGIALEPGVPVLWDSLFIESLAEGPVPDAGGGHGLLVHYLRFLDPGLPFARREAARRSLDRAVGAMNFLVATGEGAATLLRGRYPHRPVATVEPGVHPAFAAAWPVPSAPGGPRLATVANFLPAKGQMDLLDHLAELRHLPWEWHLAGSEAIDPDYAGRFRERVRSVGLDGRVLRHGVLDPPALARLLAAADLFVFPSRYEAYGMALAEAVAAELPIVTTAVGEAARLVRDGATGFVIPPRNGAEFRAALARLLEDESLRRQFRGNLSGQPVRTWDDAFEDFRRGVEGLFGPPGVNGRGP